MKKLLYFLILLIPFSVKAYGIDNFRMDVTVLPNGDLYVIEMYEMSGKYNGSERAIYYRSDYTSIYGSSLSSTGDIKIYDGTSVELISIKGVNYSDTADLKIISGDEFRKVTTAYQGDYGVYTATSGGYGETLRIYNPSSNSKDFYIEYILKDMAITHNDVTEVGFNPFTNSSESIENLDIYIHVPNNKDLFRVWAHGPLWGNIDIIDNQTAHISINDLDAYEAIDLRFVFDKILTTNKKTNVNVYDKIIEIETRLADEANLKREKIKKEETTYKVIHYTLLTAYVAGLAFIVARTYVKYDKEYKKEFIGEYFRDFPADYSPSTVGYLMRKKVTTDDLSAGIMDLIRKKAIKYQQLDENGKDFKFVRGENIELSEEENRIMKFVFQDDDTKEITLKELKKKASSGYSSFITRYDNWKYIATSNAQKEEFYESVYKARILGILYSIFGIGYGIILIEITLLGILLEIICIICIVYFSTFTKRTKKGNEQHAKWKGLKKFMEDFGTMDTKDLPQIELWDKYLVYAITLGCADKLSKVMQIKVQEMGDPYTTFNTYDLYYLHNITRINRMVNMAVTSSMNSAYSARSAAIASSSSSSGGGFGGGFSGGSGGGGSFGGGGGVGRF